MLYNERIIFAFYRSNVMFHAIFLFFFFLFSAIVMVSSTKTACLHFTLIFSFLGLVLCFLHLMLSLVTRKVTLISHFYYSDFFLLWTMLWALICLYTNLRCTWTISLHFLCAPLLIPLFWWVFFLLLFLWVYIFHCTLVALENINKNGWKASH